MAQKDWFFAWAGISGIPYPAHRSRLHVTGDHNYGPVGSLG